MSKKSVIGFRAKTGDVALNSMGTSPAVTSIAGGTSKLKDGADDPEILDLMGAGDVYLKVVVTSGSGTPAIDTDNVVITLPEGVDPRKVFISDGETAPKFHVADITDNVVSIGTKVAPAASTAYTIELICVM